MALSGLVADYGSSEDEEDLNSELLVQRKRLIEHGEPSKLENPLPVIEETITKPKKKKKKKKKLSNPLRCTGKSQLNETASVFYNPFQKEQEAKNAILEKHVKLSENPKDIKEINGKKICWSHRKGRCKFGHKCKFAHDSDLATPIVDPKYLNVNKNSSTSSTSGLYNLISENIDTEVVEEEEVKKRKMKAGLTDSVVPNKRSQKLYQQMKSKEQPWLSKS